MIKVSELGGDGQDVPFEQAFSNLAHAFLRDKAPSLLDHELGFQMLDRNQENTKAVGVMAFKVGSHQLFAPVFFLSGDLKGHELLYIKNQDMFVPMKENWLNYIINRKPNILGSGVSRQTASMGVMQPDLNRLTQSPYKYASCVRPFLPKYAHLCTSGFGKAVDEFSEHCRTRLDLSHFIKQAGLPMLQVLVDTLQRKPKLAHAFDEWHGIGALQGAVKEATVRLRNKSVLDDPYKMVPKYQAPLTTGSLVDLMEKDAADSDKGPDPKQKVKIITFDSSMVVGDPEGPDEADAEKLLKDEVLIKDERTGDEVSVPYNIQVEQKLTNPDETGIYMLLTKPGEFKKCLIITNPHGPDGRQSHCLVIELETKDWCNADRDAVWVSGQTDEDALGGEDDWQTWFDKLPDTTSVSTDAKNRFVAIGPRRNATAPFGVEKEIGDKSYDVEFSTQSSHRGFLSAGLDKYHQRALEIGVSYDEYDKWRDGERVHIDAKDGTDLRSNRGDLYIPKGYKILKLKETAEDKWRRTNRENSDCCVSDSVFPHDGADRSENQPIQPGTIMDAELSVMTKTSQLEILHDGSQYFVNGGNGLNEIDSVIHLVRDHGFREDISRHMMKQAASHRVNLVESGPFRCRVKYAEPYLTDGGPSAPAIPEPDRGGYNPMGWPGATQSTYEEEFVVPDLQASNTDPNIYNVNPANTPDPMDVNAVQQAADSGQKEVFDVSMIGSMLKAVRDDTMIDRYLPDLVKGMDRLGRILFQFYWHQDQFADRFGKQDLPELEDSLRNAFEMIGDVTLFLKQKTIEPYPEEDANALDLGETADV
jgi:hypothetical protein